MTRPSAARVYDYFLGGAHNFAVDRDLAERVTRITPTVGETMRANRALLRRAVRYLVGQGIRQFLDVGSGIPTVGNVHEVAQELAPDARVVYVDVDPVAVAHGRAMLSARTGAAGGHGQARGGATMVQADLREPDLILAETVVCGLIDFTQPVGLLLLGVVHFVPDADDPAGHIARLRDALVPGSYLALSHATHEDQPPEVIEAFGLSRHTSAELVLRSRRTLTGYFDGFTLVEPGLVHIPLWRPDDPDEVGDRPGRIGAYAGVGYKP